MPSEPHVHVVGQDPLPEFNTWGPPPRHWFTCTCGQNGHQYEDIGVALTEASWHRQWHRDHDPKE